MFVSEPSSVGPADNPNSKTCRLNCSMLRGNSLSLARQIVAGCALATEQMKRPSQIARVLVVVLVAVLSACQSGGGNGGANSAYTGVCAPLPAVTAANFEPRLEKFLNNYCYRKQNWKHDPHVRTTNGVHPFVKIWYSPSLWKWLTVQGRDGEVPDGALLVKEQYPEIDAPINGWSIMVKDKAASWDGWYWAALSAPTPSQKITFDPNPPGGCAEIPVAFVGIGNTNGTDCLNCHSSAVNLLSTYANAANVTSPSASSKGPTDVPDVIQSWKSLSQMAALQPALKPIPVHTSALTFLAPVAPGSYPCMVPETFDHVISGPKPVGPEQFLTSDQCSACHDATGTLHPVQVDHPSMMYPDALEPIANLSPYGEWRYSMMGLSGRDPIFFAQLDTESTIHDNLQDHPGTAAPFIQDLCLHCHGVMGQRQYHIDNPGSDVFFTRDQLNDLQSKYGNLGRDGVSCAVCHHVAPQGLGDLSTFTGNFNVGPANEVYGQFNSPLTYSMQSALGITPKQADQISSPTLCGSCHTIILPVYDAQGNRVTDNGQPKTFYEQTTFLEWLNSDFANVSCQSCHMPQQYGAPPTQLAYKIANIEDNTFPPAMFRVPDPEIDLQARAPFSRHTLLGINVFALEMFSQFRKDLGLYSADPNLPPPHFREPVPPVSSQRTAISSSVGIATTQTALVSVGSVAEGGGNLQADVHVVNLSGHSFPSGEGFRRAFLDFQVLDNNGNVLWASGDTNSDGIIIGADGSPLVTEFFTPTQQTVQPHFWTGNPVTSQNQVQIYEELVRDPQNMLTTSFLALDHKVKDNRLQPRGWSSSGPFAAETAPVGTGADPDYQNGSGTSDVRYMVPLSSIAGTPFAVRVSLYYQAIPPYYLAQRAADASGPDTERLVDFADRLTVEGTPVENWRLLIATASAPIP